VKIHPVDYEKQWSKTLRYPKVDDDGHERQCSEAVMLDNGK